MHMPTVSWRSRSVRVAERLALPTSVHGVAGSNPTGGEILPEPKRHFIAQSLSCSPFHRLEMTEILLKGRKTLTPSIHPSWRSKVLNHRSKDFYFFMYIFGWFSQEFLLESYRYTCLANPASASDSLIGLDFYRSPVSFAQK